MMIAEQNVPVTEVSVMKEELSGSRQRLSVRLFSWTLSEVEN